MASDAKAPIKLLTTLMRTGALTAILLVVSAGSMTAAQEKVDERFSAFARNSAVGLGPTGATRVQITISRWSTDEERNHLLSVLLNDSIPPTRMRR